LIGTKSREQAQLLREVISNPKARHRECAVMHNYVISVETHGIVTHGHRTSQDFSFTYHIKSHVITYGCTLFCMH